MQKKQDNFKTPNEKFDEEFAEIGNESASSTSQKQKFQSSNFKTPNQKFDEEFKQNDQQ
ncbi:hypothetical protein ACTHSJ_14755 [Paenibacillus cellulositrophicus]|uniref:Small, acid-soluble spore protein gamma-type n=1 Tax=Paenibacillus favisporus TaxID=221028 RepID=A0ABV2EZW9_9BACL|nr:MULTISPECIES: hypothetical protein [Paenibacillus]MCM2996387.1 hypothetical protein [Paenibacillus cellulositrophicus]GIO63921.1 hypothetical protein J43TS9_54950 [Paenibacillus cineris]